MAVSKEKILDWSGMYLKLAGLIQGTTEITTSAAEINILTGVTATAAEINTACDASLGTQTLAAAGEIALGSKLTNVANATGADIAVTLAAPTAAEVGLVKVIYMTVRTTHDITLALTNVVGGTQAATATFDAVGETLVLVGGNGKWIVLKELGVTLS